MTKEYYVVVDKEIIPRQFRESKYKDLVDEAKNLADDQCIQVEDNEDISITAIMSLMRKEGYKVTQRTVNGVKTLYIYNKPAEA